MNKQQKEKIRWRTIKKAWSLAAAMISGKAVSKARIKKRIIICEKCEEIKYTGKYHIMKCNICDCPLSKDNKLVNLARYKETKQYGCKHPKGSKWKGV